METAKRAQALIKEIRAVVAERRQELLTKDLPRFVRPTFAFVADAERRAGLPVDIVHIQLAEKDKLAAGPMRQLFGPDWDKLRLVVHGKQIAVLLGSETDLLDAALVNLKEGKAGLAGSKMTEGFAKLQTTRATAAFHLSVAGLLGLVHAQAGPHVTSSLTSFALTASDSALRLDLFLPVVDLKAVAAGLNRGPS